MVAASGDKVRRLRRRQAGASERAWAPGWGHRRGRQTAAACQSAASRRGSAIRYGVGGGVRRGDGVKRPGTGGGVSDMRRGAPRATPVVRGDSRAPAPPRCDSDSQAPQRYLAAALSSSSDDFARGALAVAGPQSTSSTSGRGAGEAHAPGRARQSASAPAPAVSSGGSAASSPFTHRPTWPLPAAAADDDIGMRSGRRTVS